MAGRPVHPDADEQYPDADEQYPDVDEQSIRPSADEQPTHQRPDEQPTHSPREVGACSTPVEYYTAMRRSRGRICVRFDDPDVQSVLRYDEPLWERYDRPRTRGRGVVVRLDRAGVLASLRLGRPALVTHDEVQHLFATARRRRGRERSGPGRNAPDARADSRERRFRDWHAVRNGERSVRDGPTAHSGREGRP